MSSIEQLRALCGGPRDGALLRLSIANALLGAGQPAQAISELRRALEFDADYSAAWKQLARALVESGDAAGAIAAYEHGVEAAQRRGDKQAQREMEVFLRRLKR